MASRRDTTPKRGRASSTRRAKTSKSRVSNASSGSAKRSPIPPPPAVHSDAQRKERRFPSTGPQDSDARSCFQRDRDRILYSSYFRRLALITQVVSPDEGYDFHNRLTHVLKVAQIGRRLSEKLIARTDRQTIETLGGLDPETVEAACLAHDLGHPPFGHITEHLLDSKARKLGNMQGFEGNAQSFRVVTKLERKYRKYKGLNLTRATLCAILKYPWTRATAGKRKDKWGAFDSELDDFKWARVDLTEDERTLEAKLMDWADDIAYSVHDMEDFYRGGRIPLHRLRLGSSEREFTDLLEGAARRCNLSESKKKQWEEQATNLLGSVPVSRRYERRREDDTELSIFASVLITRFIDATRLTERGLEIDDDVQVQVALLKQLTWQFVIEDPALATQQMGQRKVIETLFDVFREDALSARCFFNLFPQRYKSDLTEADDDDDKLRIVIDLIASMTEQQAIQMYHRITGVSLGAVFGIDL